MAEKFVVEKEIKIKAHVSKVWDVLTKPEWTVKYMFGCEPVTDWKPGSTILWRGAENGVIYVKGNIVKTKPREYLQYTTFNANSDLPDVPSNYLTVTIDLSEADGFTRLKISQGDFAVVEKSRQRYEDSVKNWEMVLPKIKELAEE